METFFALLALCAGNSPVPGEFPAQRPVTWSFDVFFGLHPNKWLSKQWWGWWFEMLPRPLWRHCNVLTLCAVQLLDWCNSAQETSNTEVLMILWVLNSQNPNISLSWATYAVPIVEFFLENFQYCKGNLCDDYWDNLGMIRQFSLNRHIKNTNTEIGL